MKRDTCPRLPRARRQPGVNWRLDPLRLRRPDLTRPHDPHHTIPLLLCDSRAHIYEVQTAARSPLTGIACLRTAISSLTVALTLHSIADASRGTETMEGS